MSDGQIKNQTQNQAIVRDIAIAMDIVPPRIDLGYLETCDRAATYLGNPSPTSARALAVVDGALSPPSSVGNPWLNVRNPVYHAGHDAAGDASGALRNAAVAARNNVLEFAARVGAFASRAKAAGLVSPENPLAAIVSLNAVRKGRALSGLDPGRADGLVRGIRAYISLLEAERAGSLDIDRPVDSAAQLSSVGVSFDGFGGSGDGIVDLMQLVPDADAIRRERAREALTVTDFKKRTPRVLFTADYSPDGVARGVIVGWRRMADASGYLLRRRSVFDGREIFYTLTNAELTRRYGQIKEYVRAWVLSFYDGVDDRQVLAYLDSDAAADSYYVYRVQGYQTTISGRSVFAIDVAPVSLSQARRLELRAELERLDPGAGPDTISPYPVLARQLFGNDQLDWILAGTNIRASIARADPRSTTRRYAYPNAQLDFLFSQMDQGKFVAPKNVDEVARAIVGAVGEFGVTQVVLELLQETGVLYHFDGRDPRGAARFDRADSSTLESSGIFSSVAAAIDVETATLDLRALSSNLPRMLEAGPLASAARLEAGRPAAGARPIEIAFPTDPERTDAARSSDEVQFLNSLGDVAAGSVDLTTFEGLSKLMRTIRVFSDIAGNRGSPIASSDVERAPPPPPPKLSPADRAKVVSSDVIVAQGLESKKAAAVLREDRLERQRERIEEKKSAAPARGTRGPGGRSPREE